MPAGRLYNATMSRRLNKRQVKQVQKIVEKNKQLRTAYVDLDDASFASSSPVFVELTSIAEGDDNNLRDSDRINLKSIRLNLVASKLPATTNGDVTTIRVLIARSKTGPLTVADFPASTIALPDNDKMQVLYDRYYALGPYDTDGIFIDSVLREIPIKLKFANKKVPHLTVGYDDDVSATAAQHNPIYLNIEATGNNTMRLDGVAIVKWFDRS